jgi:hypothetical protein
VRGERTILIVDRQGEEEVVVPCEEEVMVRWHWNQAHWPEGPTLLQGPTLLHVALFLVQVPLPPNFLRRPKAHIS